MLKEKSVFLLDMDGTIYLGEELIFGAKEFLKHLQQQGKRYFFLTNNSSKNKKKYVEKLRRLGIEAKEEDVFTSGEATTIVLNQRMSGGKIFLMGTPALEEEFANAGFQLVKERDKEIDAVVLGFDTTLTYEKLWIACDYIREKGKYIATHPDFNCPLEGGKFMPDAGAMIAFIEASTGIVPEVIGKPNEKIIEAICNQYHLNRKDLVIVGDRLYTDIKTGENAGITSVLVLSGETSKEDYEASNILADYIFPSVKELGEAI